MDTIKERIKKEKADGTSLKTLAEKYHLAKSTVSLYCRDVFDHPLRKYSTEKEAREAIRSKKLHKCANPSCNNLTTKTHCLSCYRRQTPIKKPSAPIPIRKPSSPKPKKKLIIPISKYIRPSILEEGCNSLASAPGFRHSFIGGGCEYCGKIG